MIRIPSSALADPGECHHAMLSLSVPFKVQFLPHGVGLKTAVEGQG